MLSIQSQMLKNQKKSKTINKLNKRELKKKKSSFFRTGRGITKGRRRKSTVEYIVRRSLEALPDKYRKHLEEDKESIITNLTNQIVVSGQETSPYYLLMQQAEYRRRAGHEGTKEDLWSDFVNRYSPTYHKYYSYMRRLGYDPKEYWFDRVDITFFNSSVEAECALPAHQNSFYVILIMSKYYSGDGFEAILY